MARCVLVHFSGMVPKNGRFLLEKSPAGELWGPKYPPGPGSIPISTFECFCILFGLARVVWRHLVHPRFVILRVVPLLYMF